LLVVVGRQHVAAIRALWQDRGSELWRGEVTRSFAPSAVEPQADTGAATAAAAAGSTA
jgi:hypothetical protein